MEKDSKFSFSGRLKSFRFAFRGILTALQSQYNLWIHFAAAFAVICIGFLVNLNATEWALIIFAIGLVWMAEIFNTAIEFLVDHISPEYHEKAGKVKDLAAGAVLVAAMTAAVIGVIVFGEKIAK